MPWTGNYEELRDHLRQFINFDGAPAPYDFNGVVHLLLATLDNLRQNALEVELQEIRESFTDEQAVFFLKLADLVRRSSGTEAGDTAI